MANKLRASFDIVLNGKDYTLRPSFEAISEFIDKTGMDPFEALAKCQRGGNVKIIVGAIWAGITGEAILQGDRKAPSYEKIGDECQSHGFADCFIHALKFLTTAVASDETLKKSEETEAPTSQSE